jgi:tetratricopeptide (TPR) repeat protein
MLISKILYPGGFIRCVRAFLVCQLISSFALLSDNAMADRLMTGGSTGNKETTLETTTDPVSVAISQIDDGNYGVAIGILLSLIEVNPDNPEAFNQLGYAHSRLQNYDLALEFYHQALEIDPEHAGALAYMGKVYLELGKVEIAENHLRQLDLICLFGCDPFSSLQEAISLYYANKGD